MTELTRKYFAEQGRRGGKAKAKKYSSAEIAEQARRSKREKKKPRVTSRKS